MGVNEVLHVVLLYTLRVMVHIHDISRTFIDRVSLGHVSLLPESHRRARIMPPE
jgi:hypothetical protein